MEQTMWVYRQSEPGLWTVGFYEPSGKWQPESDHESREAAGGRVHYLNGGADIRKFEAWQREANRVYPFIEREA